MTSKPSEDEVSADELVAPVAGGTASVFATEDTVASSDTAIQCKIAPYYRNAWRSKKKYVVLFNAIRKTNIRNKSQTVDTV